MDRMAERRLSRSDQSTLNTLQWHWDTCYSISTDGDTWSASPVSAPNVLLTAETSLELLGQIRDDYQHNDRRNLREPSPGAASRLADGCSL